KELQTVSTLRPGFTGANSCAEIVIHPSGRFLYGSNRGSDSLAVFGIEPNRGTLTWLEDQSTGGKKPRYFGLLPSGTGLVAANQDSDSLFLYEIDLTNGRLRPSGITAEVPAPACVRFFRPGKD